MFLVSFVKFLGHFIQSVTFQDKLTKGLLHLTISPSKQRQTAKNVVLSTLQCIT